MFVCLAMCTCKSVCLHMFNVCIYTHVLHVCVCFCIFVIVVLIIYISVRMVICGYVGGLVNGLTTKKLTTHIVYPRTTTLPHHPPAIYLYNIYIYLYLTPVFLPIGNLESRFGTGVIITARSYLLWVSIAWG